MGASLLLIEDNEDILANLYAYLEPMGYEIDSARNGKHGFEMAAATPFDCIILDILLPGLDGISVCQKLRGNFSLATPIIMLTALNKENDLVAGLDAGADDYLVKPFSMRELEARIRALLRRGAKSAPSLSPGILVCGDITLDLEKHLVWRQNQPLRLSPASFRILERLARAAPSIVRREDLEEYLWGDEPRCESALRTHIHELRRQIDKPFGSDILKTVPHIGYRLENNQ